MNRRSFMQTAAAKGLSGAFAGALPGMLSATTVQAGGTLRLGADGSAATDTLNPLQLLGADHTQNVAFCGYAPSLAESWEGNADGNWVIRLY